ncbi:uncharacterized protein LOC110836502 isoform X3 [Zootermopsis nevadensis]|uniref:uncharacterized protein LOC110836502 isoform X3 n=1 Tax=Zootermopsis nevadensis TaxID=136037 RepID=UPI000B8E579C|nr:uncharacterized protein LOC110836502 isoform X3 [Zootermopsis nevadensis]
MDGRKIRMKLSVSAYRAQASAHKKILNSSYQMLLNYGATCTTSQPQHPAPTLGLPSVKVEKVEGSSSAHHHLHHSPESWGGGGGPASSSSSSSPLPPSALRRHRPMMVDSTGIGPGPSSGPPGQTSSSTAGDDTTASGVAGGTMSEGSASESSPRQSGVQSLVTSREEDGEEDGQGGEAEDASGTGSKRDSIASSDKSPGQRTKSNQRWMKLRTTVQLSGAITTIQKKPPLKREDSFLKRFSTRQIPETQETMDTGDDGDGGPSSQSTASTRRRRRRKQRLPRTVVNPDENFYFYWLFLLSACVLYNLWTLIVRQSFPELQSGATILWFTCDGFSDAVFLLDVAVQFRTGYLEQGLMVYDSKKLAGHYIRSRAFLMDLCALLPLDLLQFYVGIQPILRFPRFLKVYRVYNYYYMVESRTVYPNLWRVVNLVHILLILAHWFGCFYYLLSEAQGFIGVWGYPYNEPGYQQLTRKYLGSLYWSTLTLTTIGDLPTPGTNVDSLTTASSSTSAAPSTTSPLTSSSLDGLPARPRQSHKSRLLQFSSNRGYVFTIASYLIGVFIFATIVGQVGNVITNRNANRLEFERLLDGAKTYMRHHKVPGGMKRRVLRWYDYSWSRGRIQGGGDINTALGLLPDKLKTELALHVNLSVLKKVTIFQECQPEFLHDLVLKMKAYIFTPGDLICRKGEVAREMFIIADGILEVISETGRVLTTMKAGDFFGEIGILNLDGLNKRTADVRSVGYSELFSLSREDVLAAMKDYPEAQEILQSLGRKRLMDAREVSRTKSSGHHDRKASGSPAVKDGVAGTDVDGRAGKRIVEKLRSDVKGLKNVLRKSRHGARMKDESMELQPLNPGSVNARHASSAGHSGKGVLRRMSRVHSDDNYSREESLEDQSPTVSTAKLGEGLPLLQRLRLLKEKQDREEKGKPLLSPISPPPAPNTLSPPSFRLQPPEQEPQEQEVIGAGLPLIQRLLLLKQKEDHERLTMQATATVAADVLATTVKTQQEVDPKSMQSIVSPSGRKLKGRISDDSRHSSSSKEQSDDESSLVSRKPSLLNRLVSIKHKDIPSASIVKQFGGSSGGVSPHQKSDSGSSSSADHSMTTTVKVPLLRDKLKLLTQKDSTSPSSSSSSTGTVISPSIAQNQLSAKSDSDSSSSSVAVLKKQHSWSLLKKASILSSQNSNESSKDYAVTVSKSTIIRDHSSSSNKLQPGGISASQSKEQQSSNLIPVQTSSANDTKVITVCDNDGSKSIPSKLPSSLKVSELSSGKSVSLFKQKVEKLNGEDQCQQSPILQVPKVQDKLKNEETQVLAQEDKKEGEENKLKEKTTENCSEEEKKSSFEYSIETASSVGITEKTVDQPPVRVMVPSVLSQAETSAASPQRRRPKPSLLRLQKDTKSYMSIDDLSPEYSGLPFVKKLKILNERQKLAELEQKVAHVLMRSSSLDSSNAVSCASGGSGDSAENSLDPMNLTRSHSEASAMQYVRSQQHSKDPFGRTASQMGWKDDGEEATSTLPQRPTELPQDPSTEAAQSLTSPESNETLERRNLKSILKKLSASSLFSGSTEEDKESSSISEKSEISAMKGIPTDLPTAKSSNVNMQKLMRAPTIEGYAARHSKLIKSVTFNRDTLQSPPATATTPTKFPQEASGSLFPLLVATEDQPTISVQSTCISTSSSTVSTALSSSSSTDLNTNVPQQEIIPPASTPVTVALTTLPSLVSPTTISSTISSVMPLFNTSEPLRVSPAADVSELPKDTIESAAKKKSQVSFLVQNPHQKPLTANEKNFFRPSLLLPSHASLEEEYFSEVIVGIKQVIQGHLEDVQNKFQSQFQSLELEVKRRDEIISQLQKRIHELEHPESTEENHEDEDDDLSDADDGSDQPFMRGDSVDTILVSPPPALPDDCEEENEDGIVVNQEQLVADEAPYQSIISASYSTLRQRQTYHHSWEDHSEQGPFVLLDLPHSIGRQHEWYDEEQEQKVTRMPKDCVALDLGSSDTSSSSSSSSDLSIDEDDAFAADYDLHSVGHNQDWEVQMLARELERREDISRLENEVRDLKAAVSSSDLSNLTTSELNILEQVLVAKDRKVRAAARALSLDSDDSLLHEQALQPISHHKPEVRSPSLSSVLNKQSHLKQRSSNGGENLLYRTSLIKNRLLSATTKRHQLLIARSLEETPDRSLKTKVNSGEHVRNRSASSGSIAPVGRASSFTLSSASSLMRGLGNLVRNSASTSTCQASSHSSHLSSLDAATTNRAIVPTISSSCGDVSPDPNRHTSDPPPPDL